MNRRDALDFVVDDMRRARRGGRSVALALVAAFALIVIGATFVTGVRRDALAGIGHTRLSLAVVLTVFVPAFAQRVSGRSPSWFRWIPSLFVVTVMAAMLTDMRGRPLMTPSATWSDHMGCASLASGVAVAMLVMVSILANRLAPTGGRAQRWSIVALAGATGVASVELHCRGVGWDHLMAGHVVPVIAIGIAAVWYLRVSLDRRVRSVLPHRGERLERLDRLAD